MSKEMLMVVDAVANEKGVARSVIFDAMEAALASAAKKRYAEQDVTMRVAIDRNTGEYETFRRWEVVADDVVMESPDRQLRLMDASMGELVGQFDYSMPMSWEIQRMSRPKPKIIRTTSQQQQPANR